MASCWVWGAGGPFGQTFDVWGTLTPGGVSGLQSEAGVFAALGLRWLAPADRTGVVVHLPMEEWASPFVADVFVKKVN